MTPADHARENAISFECKKDALRQNQSGDWKIAFTVQGIDMDERLTKAFPGTRYVAVLVEVNDDETPKQPAKETPATPRPAPKSAGAKRDWRELPPQQQAGIRCEEAAFVHFLKEHHPDDWHETQDTADCVRLICGVTSRSELETNQKARVIWHQLDQQYAAWLHLERAS